MTAFLEEQYLGLDAMADNPTVLFTGPAGSGKTWLAMEAACREVAVGRRGRLLCFNRLLAKQLTADLADVAGLTVGTLHQELLRITGVPAPAGARASFWEQELPDRALEVLLNRPDLAGDFVIVDEVQDIAKGPFLDVLDLLVTGGLRSGRVLLFGDFERQAIFETGDGRALLRARAPHQTNFRLSANCRNLPRIGYQVNLLAKLEPGYQRFRRQDDGIDPAPIPYTVGSDQSPLLSHAVKTLRADGYKLNEIVVLSPLREGSTAETTTDTWLRQVLYPADGRRGRPGQLLNSTIQAYKGLEAPAVVVTDLDRRGIPGFEALLYVGLTRATDRLFAVVESGTLRAAIGGTT
ncbi:ATP-binding domain-containing protein [Phytomonospora sp. NPDC050363]|uniref:ATP-binding domain-containing protein n=1 Tax=Phytomonospora sp. NPDC050363 TaxID=3155642 RepID=UPI0033DC9C85